MSSVGQALGGAVGAVAGFLIGGPTGALYGAQIGMMAGGYLDPPKGPTNYGPRLDDLTVQTSTYGAIIPRCYGVIAVNGNVFWLENNRLKEKKKKQKSGGKGGGGGATNVTYSYYATFAVGLCQGPIAGVRRVWIGSKLVYDMSSTNPDTISASQSFASQYMEVHTGANDQPASARMQATLGTENTPAYRGLAYIVFKDYPLKDHGNSLIGAQVKVEIVCSSAGLSASISHALTDPQRSCGPGDSANGVTIIPASYQTKSAGGLFVNGWSVVVLSADGTTYNPLVASNSVATVVYGNGVWIYAAGWYIYRSDDDGASWSLAWDGSFSINSACFVNGRFYFGDEGYNLLTTTDGITFTPLSVAFSTTYLGGPGSQFIAHNGSVYCMVGTGGGGCATSSDGNTWTTHTLPSFYSGYYWGNIAACAGVFIITDPWTITNQALMSTDGVNWEFMTLPATGYFSISSSGDCFVAVTDSATAYRGIDVYLSTDGVDWEGPFSASGTDGYYDYPTWYVTPIPGGVLVNCDASGDVFTVMIADSPQTAILGDIIKSESLQISGLSLSDLDVSSLTQEVRGYKVSSIASIRSAIEPLQGVWPFDVIQAGYQIECKPRGSASVKTISADDLGAVAAGSTAASLTVSREMDSQIPGRVSLRYLDPSREYDTGEQYAERLSVERDNTKQLDIAVVLSGSEAAQAAERLLYIYWMERYGVSLTLPPTHGDLEPSDVVTVLSADGSYLLRLKQIDYQADGVISCRATFAGQAIYTPAAIGEEPVTTAVSELLPTPSTTYALLDMPCMVDAQNTPGFTLAATASGNWPGAVLYRSSDAGSTWGEVVTQYPPGAVIGTLQGNSVAAHDGRMIDTATVLDVALVTGELASVTQTAMFNGANNFAFGADGRWEIIAAQNCVLQVDGTYRLTDLMRGRFGTEWASGLHASDDTLVLLDAGDLTFSVESSGLIGLSRDYRAISDGLAMDSQASTAFAYLGVNLKPLSPVYLNGNRHPTTNDWSLDWIRRTRIGGDWRDGVDAAIGEATEAYIVEIYADGSYAAVKRSINTTSAAATYSSANQVADFGSNQSTLYVKVYQVSATVGKGYPLTTSITR